MSELLAHKKGQDKSLLTIHEEMYLHISYLIYGLLIAMQHES